MTYEKEVLKRLDVLIEITRLNALANVGNMQGLGRMCAGPYGDKIELAILEAMNKLEQEQIKK